MVFNTMKLLVILFLIKLIAQINIFKVLQDEINIQEGSINQKFNNTMSIMFCMEAAFKKTNFCLVARIVLFDTAGPHLLTFCILEPYPSKDIGLDLNHVTLMTLL